jgi:serine/threonine protein phosphatase PrpC
VSDRGRRRRRNEDAYSLAAEDDCQAAVVCDGVATTEASGLAAGAAARAAMAELCRGLGTPDKWSVLVGAAIRAAQGVLSASSPYDVPVFQGSTTIAVALTRPGGVVVGNIGDSRAYWVGGDGTAVLLTTDDSWVREAVVAGASETEAQSSPRAHEITAWLGPDAGPIEPHIAQYTPQTDGVVVVCTDGLWNYVESPDSLAALVMAGTGADRAPGAVARRLVQFALQAGGADNVTVAVLDAPAQPTNTDQESPSARR